MTCKHLLKYLALILFLFPLIMGGHGVAQAKDGQPPVDIISVEADIDSELIRIYGLAFGDTPQVMLNNQILNLAQWGPEYIEAQLWSGIDPATYRLFVARDGKFNAPGQIDLMDVTIGTQGPLGPQGPVGPSYHIVRQTYDTPVLELSPGFYSQSFRSCTSGMLTGGSCRVSGNGLTLVDSVSMNTETWMCGFENNTDATIFQSIHMNVHCLVPD